MAYTSADLPLADRLQVCGQAHLLEGLDNLDAQARARFLGQVAAMDWDGIAACSGPSPISGTVGAPSVIDCARCDPSPVVGVGEAAYRDGAVAVLMVAGGSGDRLGSGAPKGCFPIGAHSGKSLFQLQAEKMLTLSRRLERRVLFLIMTSPATDVATREFFAAHACFGLDPAQIRFFCQALAPSLGLDGKALLASPGVLLACPDGHGGCLPALHRAGLLEEMAREGVRHLVYVQVDNPLAVIDDPALVGLAASERADVVTKVMPKRDPDEKVGSLVRVEGRHRIVEYVDLTSEEARRSSPDGESIHRWGSPALHCWSLDFLRRMAGVRLPFHRSRKPLRAWVGGSMRNLEGWKCERFIFDLIPFAEKSIALAIRREDEFAPVKNASGADSPASARRLASDLYARWLARCGVEVRLPRDAHIEISPLYAASADELAHRWDGRCGSVTGDFYLEAEAEACAPGCAGTGRPRGA